MQIDFGNDYEVLVDCATLVNSSLQRTVSVPLFSIGAAVKFHVGMYPMCWQVYRIRLLSRTSKMCFYQNYLTDLEHSRIERRDCSLPHIQYPEFVTRKMAPI